MLLQLALLQVHLEVLAVVGVQLDKEGLQEGAQEGVQLQPFSHSCA